MLKPTFKGHIYHRGHIDAHSTSSERQLLYRFNKHYELQGQSRHR